MAVKKQLKKSNGVVGAKVPTAKQSRVTVKQARPAARVAVPAKAPTQTVSKKVPGNAGPTVRTCPLVLDGEIETADFSPVLCLSCDEFDCRFCEAAAGSGGLRSRLFATPDENEEEEEGDDEWDSGTGFREEDDDGADIDDEKIF